MSRPTRETANHPNYAEKITERIFHIDDLDESSDDEDDPDKMEVPGGGRTLDASVNLSVSLEDELGDTGENDDDGKMEIAGGIDAFIKNELQDDTDLTSKETLGDLEEDDGNYQDIFTQGKNGSLNKDVKIEDQGIGKLLGAGPSNFKDPHWAQFPSDSFSAFSSLSSPVKKEHLFPGVTSDSIFSAMLNMPIINPMKRSPSQTAVKPGPDPYPPKMNLMPHLPIGELEMLYNNMLRSGFGMSMLNGMGNLPMMSRPGSIPKMPKQAPVSLGDLWRTSNIKMDQQATAEAEEDFSHEDEDMGVAEVYADYKPSKLDIGEKHPDPVVETASLASVLPPDVHYTVNFSNKLIKSGVLSALQLEAVVYACQQHEFMLPSKERAGYLIGDGAGVGKGRTVAGIILENWNLKRKRALWISVSADLKYDSERDLKDIGASHIPVFALNKHKYGKLTFGDGVIFSTYASLIGESSQGGRYNSRLKQIMHWFGKKHDGVIIFDECHRAKNLCPVGSSKPTKTGMKVHELQKELSHARVVYASATGASEPKNMAYMTRLGIWGVGTPFKEFNDFIQAVEKRGVGAMEIVAMDMKLRGAYIARQLSFQGVTFNIDEVPLSPQFVQMYDESVALWVEALQRFIEAIELMCVEKHIRKGIWAQFWASHQRFFKYLCIASKVKRACEIARDAVKNGKCVVIGLQSTGEARTLDQLERDEGELNDFVSTAKGVFQSLVEKHFPAPNRKKINELLGLKETSAMFQELMEEASAGSSSAVAGSSSGSSNKRKPMRRAAQKATKRVKFADSDDSDCNADPDSDFEMSGASSHETETDTGSASNAEDSTPVESDDSATKSKLKKKKKKQGPIKRPGPPPVIPSKASSDLAYQMKSALLEKIDKVGEKFPPNTLDQLIDDLGGPAEVAEMTGRKGRVVQDDQGHVTYETRSETDISLEYINMKEKDRFMKGEKLIAIISEAASSGISLQSDRRAKNQRRRVHITLELPWSADRAIQQFGRTHRSNQVNAPEYKFLISDLAGEHRFASIVAKRLESLGALTHGDRRATETRDLSKFHIDNKYGRIALETIMRNILRGDPSTAPKDYVGNFHADVAGALVGVGLIVNSEEQRGTPVMDKDCTNMSKFLNRILGMPVKLQNLLFEYFTDTLAQIINQAKKTGRFDLGILDVSDSGTGKILEKPEKIFKSKHATGEGEIRLHELQVERGLSWKEAQEKEVELDGELEGFYLSKQVRNGKRIAILAISDSGKETKDKKSALYSVYRPNTGLQIKREILRELQSKYTKVESEECASQWVDQYDNSETKCTHAFWNGRCKNTMVGNICEVGLRKRTYFVLSGTILLVWQKVESVFARCSSGNAIPKMQVVRVRSGDLRIVGMLVPNHCVEMLIEHLREPEEVEEPMCPEPVTNSSDSE